MKKILGLFLMLSVLGSGCLETVVQEKAPVLYLNLSLGEDSNGTVFLKEISARGDEISKLQAPEGVIPKDFPAYYVSVMQNMMIVTYQNGKDYTGPGNYSFELGFKPEFNKSIPLVIGISGVDKEGNFTSKQFLVINWSTETIGKTFK